MDATIPEEPASETAAEDFSEEEEADKETAHKQVDESVAPPPVEIEAPDLYRYERCTIHLTATFLPDDGDGDGRLVILGVRNDQDTPLIAAPCRFNHLAWPEPVLTLLTALEADLPRRKQHLQEKLRATQTKLAEAEAARKQKAAQPKPEPQKKVAAETPAPAPAAPSTAPQKPTKSSKPSKEASDLEQLSFL